MGNTAFKPGRKPSSVAEDVELHCLLGALLWEKKGRAEILARDFLIGLVKARLDWAVD